MMVTYALVFVNGVDYVKTSNLGGHHILVFDEKTLNFEYEILLNYYLIHKILQIIILLLLIQFPIIRLL